MRRDYDEWYDVVVFGFDILEFVLFVVEDEDDYELDIVEYVEVYLGE